MDNMRVLKPSKVDLILNLFSEVGDTFSVQDVCDITGVKNYGSLRSALCYIRKAKHIPDENRIDVRIENGQCVRVN